MDLDEACAIAEAALPAVRLPRDAFREWLARRDGDGELELDRDRVIELWLACAIGRGDAAAVRAFEDRYVAPLGTTLARMRLGDAELDEVKQLVRAKLLVADASGRARVEAYAGQGRLAGLVQVVATREALTLRRRGRRDAEAPRDDDLADPLVGAADPGLEIAKAKYRVAFRAAFAEAVSALAPRDRNLLRLHLLGGVTLEQLAVVHGVHRASIVRWLKDARDAVLTKTKAALTRTLGVRPDELESLHALAESRLDASIERLLRTSDDPDEHDEP